MMSDPTAPCTVMIRGCCDTIRYEVEEVQVLAPTIDYRYGVRRTPSVVLELVSHVPCASSTCRSRMSL